MATHLTDHDEIRTWVSARAGSPALISMPDGLGDSDGRLRLVFGQCTVNAGSGEGPDRRGGIQMITWTEWFEIFDNEKLTLLVPVEEDNIDESTYSIEKRA